MSRFEANGIALEYDSFGNEASEPMLLISGLGAQMTRWTVAFCELLAAQGFRVIRYDNRDAGLSTHSTQPVPDIATLAATLGRGERPEIPYTLADMAADAAALLDALGIERAHIVGRSMGGMIAQLFAAAYPERTLSLTSFMSSSGNPALPPTDPEVMGLLMGRPTSAHDDREGYLAQSVAFSRLISSPGYGFDEAAERAQILSDLERAYNPAGFGRQIAAIAVDGDRRERLSRITAPTLVIHGEDDKLLPAAGGRDTAANIAGAELKIFAGMGHDLPPQLYEEIIQAISANARRALPA